MDQKARITKRNQKRRYNDLNRNTQDPKNKYPTLKIQKTTFEIKVQRQISKTSNPNTRSMT